MQAPDKAEAWQHFLKTRPMFNKEQGVGRGLKADAKTGKWKKAGGPLQLTD